MYPRFFSILLVLLGGFFAGPAMAQPSREPGVLPLDSILPGIRRSHPGQFYDADGPTQGADGSEHYHLKWMTPDGRIEWLDTDARTGRVLGASPGRDSFDGPPPVHEFGPGPGFEHQRNFRDNNDGDDGDRGGPGGERRGGFGRRGRGRDD